MPDGVIIRRMERRDVDGVYEIERASFSAPWKRQDFVKEMTQNKCARYLIAEEAGRIIGFAGAWIVLDEAHITNIAVDEAHRGRGIGRRLTQSLLQYAANLGVVYTTLEVRRSNVRAQNLYRSLGFEYVGVRKRYYVDNGEDAFLFVCQHMPEAEADFEEAETVREEENGLQT